MLYKVVFFPSPSNDLYLEELRKKLSDLGHTFSEDDFEYVFIIGGDGSFIHFSKEYAFSGKKIVGLGKGLVSFLSYLDLDILSCIDQLEFFDIELLEIKGKDTFYAFNDACVVGDLLLSLDMYVNDMHLQKYRGSGLLFSTKAGSTAKNKSHKGPILFPGTDSWLVNEIGAQITNKFGTLNTSVIFSSHEVVKIDNLSSYKLYVDGHLLDIKDSDLQFKLVKGTSKVLFGSSERYVEKLKEIFLT